MARLKPLEEQVVSILGASSGIGLETAPRFTAHGGQGGLCRTPWPWTGIVGWRDPPRGGEVHVETCDVLRFDQVKHPADLTVELYGGIDTGVHLAAVSIYAKFEQIRPQSSNK